MIPPRALIPHPVHKHVLVTVDGDRFRVFNIADSTHITPTFQSCLQKADENVNDEIEKKHPEQKKAPVIIQGVFSHNGNEFCLVTADKVVRFFDTTSWEQTAYTQAEKRPTCVSYLRDDSGVVVADREGDVYFISNKNGVCSSELRVESLALIFDVVPTLDSKFLITADRNGKLRVSHNPNGYNIFGFCLGHSNLITKVLCVSPSLVVSASADGTVKVWDYLKGLIVGCTSKLDADFKNKGIVNGVVFSDGIIAFSLEGRKQVYFTNMSDDGSLSSMTSIETAGDVHGLVFDNLNRLWITHATYGSPVSVALKGTDGYALLSEKDTDLLASVKSINDNIVFGDVRDRVPTWGSYIHPDPEHSKGRTTADYYEKKALRVESNKAKKATKAERKAAKRTERGSTEEAESTKKLKEDNNES